MFERDAVELLKLMGATGRVPGGLEAADVPAARARLESAIAKLKAEARADDQDGASEEDQDQDREPPVTIAARAVPLLNLLERVAAANAELVWEGQ